MVEVLVFQSRHTGPDQQGFSNMVVKDMGGAGPLFFEKHVQLRATDEPWETAAKKALGKRLDRSGYGQQGKVFQNSVLVMTFADAQGLLAELLQTQRQKIAAAERDQVSPLDGVKNTKFIVLQLADDGGSVVGTAYEGGEFFLGVSKITNRVAAVVHFGGFKLTGSRVKGKITG